MKGDPVSVSNWQESEDASVDCICTSRDANMRRAVVNPGTRPPDQYLGFSFNRGTESQVAVTETPLD